MNQLNPVWYMLLFYDCGKHHDLIIPALLFWAGEKIRERVHDQIEDMKERMKDRFKFDD